MSTPLDRQYREIKDRNKDCLLLFRVGDFYEMFHDDAEEFAPYLNLVLTKKNQIPMCGIPKNSINFYLKKILEKKNIAICEQIESIEEARNNKRSLIKRDVVKIITKGTYVDLNSINNNFILSIHEKNNLFSLFYLDVGTGEGFYEYINSDYLIAAINRINPSEIIIKKALDFFKEITVIFNEGNEENIYNDFAYGNLIAYLKKNGIDNNFKFQLENNSIYMKLGRNTLRNLEILNGIYSGKSLFSTLNKTQTPMGKRFLYKILSHPLIDIKLISERLNKITELQEKVSRNLYYKIQISDICKIANNLQNLEDVYKLAKTIEMSEKVLNFFKISKISLDIHKNILNILVLHNEKIIINSNEFKKLEEDRSKIYGEMLEEAEKNNFKLKNNNIIGFFLETNKSINDPKFILKQGLAHSNRYTNENLVFLESKINQLEDSIKDLESLFFKDFKDKILRSMEEIRKVSDLIGEIDCYQSLAKFFLENNYQTPNFTDTGFIFTESRHPIVENENFITNDFFLNKKERLWIITGPNMGGKSTALRQAAIGIFLAQCGLFVPGKMETQIFKELFVRIGAFDNITENQSTFLVEMLDCGEMVNLSSENSFIILDEVGRGTSLSYGIAISKTLIEYFDKKKSLGLVSTHFPQLAEMKSDSIIIKQMQVLSRDNQIKLLYKIINGLAEDSYGMNVAKIAGFPQNLLERISFFLNTLN